MFAFVTTLAGISILPATCSPHEAASAVLTLSYPKRKRVLHHKGSDDCVFQLLDEFIVQSKPTRLIVSPVLFVFFSAGSHLPARSLPII